MNSRNYKESGYDFNLDLLSTSYSWAIYTMDHEVVPRPRKIHDWPLNSFQDHFGLHQGKKMPK